MTPTWLAGNRLARLPESIGKLSRLTTLDASDNPLTGLPSSVVNLTSLETLEVYGDLLVPELAAAVTSGPEEVRSLLERLAAEAVSAPRPPPRPASRDVRGRSRSTRSPAPRHRPAPGGKDSASPVSFALVLAATAALLFGLWQRGLTLVYVSIASTVLAWLVEAGARVRRRRQARRHAPSARAAHR